MDTLEMIYKTLDEIEKICVVLINMANDIQKLDYRVRELEVLVKQKEEQNYGTDK